MKDRYADKMIKDSEHKGARPARAGYTVLECRDCGRAKSLRDKPCGNCGSNKTIARRKTG